MTNKEQLWKSVKRVGEVGLLTLAIQGMSSPAEAQGPIQAPSCPRIPITEGMTVTKAAEIFGTTNDKIISWNTETIGRHPLNWMFMKDKTFNVCLPIGGPNVLVIPAVTPMTVIENKNVVPPGSSPEYPVRLADGAYLTFAPNQELWVALGPDQFDEQRNKIGLQLETINGRPDSMQGLVFAPDRVPAVTAWFKTQGDMPAPTAQLLAKRSNNDEDWNKIGADFGNLWFRDQVTGKYQPWLLRLKNIGREGAGPVGPVTFRFGVKSFYQ